MRLPRRFAPRNDGGGLFTNSSSIEKKVKKNKPNKDEHFFVQMQKNVVQGIKRLSGI